MVIDREQAPAVCLLLLGVAAPVLAFFATRTLPWRAHAFVALSVTEPADLAQHNASASERGTAAVDIWAVSPHAVWPVVLALVAYEVWVLQQRTRTVGDTDAYSYAGFGDHSGAFVAHTEFWLVAGAAHAAVLLFALSPVAADFVALLTLLVVLALAAVCEPNNDHGASDSHDELVTNRVVLIALPAVAALVVYMANPTTPDPASTGNGSLLVALGFLDLGLVLAHSGGRAGFARILRARMYYMFCLAGACLAWLLSQ
jgi:hypothetical protein